MRSIATALAYPLLALLVERMACIGRKAVVIVIVAITARRSTAHYPWWQSRHSERKGPSTKAL